MITLPAMLGMVTAILQSHPLCEQAAIVETKEFSPDQFFFKVRAKFPQGYWLQARIYCNNVLPSPLTDDPQSDMALVLREIEQYLAEAA